MSVSKKVVLLHPLFERKNVENLLVNIVAEIAQLVEHDLAKVGVASSSLVFRSGLLNQREMLWWWNGRHEGLKIPCPQGRVGSSPTRSTKKNTTAEIAQLVEHDLAKVGVASSSLVFRSKKESNLKY